MEPLCANDLQLLALNDSLSDFNQQLLTKQMPDANVLFLIGVPRSGTTFLTQLLIDKLDIGYISNTIARFWKVPAVGALLQNTLLDGKNYKIDGKSEFGATSGPLGPHEFGFFWQRWFPYGKTHFVTIGRNEKQLCREVAALENTLGKPMMFKNLAACSLHAHWLSEVFPSARFLLIRRNPIDVARSIYKARIIREGGVEHWFSVKPPSYLELCNLSVEEQIARQILDIELHISQQLSRIDSSKWRVIDYDRMITNPNDVASVAGALMNMEAETMSPVKSIVASSSSEKVSNVLDDTVRKIVLDNKCWEQLYSEVDNVSRD
jgi:hypothetical protein